MSMFSYKRDECIAKINRHTLCAVLNFIQTLIFKGPTTIRNEFGGWTMTPDHFSNFAVNEVSWYFEALLNENLSDDPKRITREAITLILEHFGYHSQNVSCDTDTTSFAWEYSNGVDFVARRVKERFIQVAK